MVRVRVRLRVRLRLTAARAAVIAWLSASGKHRFAMYTCVAPSSTPAEARLQAATLCWAAGCNPVSGNSLCHTHDDSLGAYDCSAGA